MFILPLLSESLTTPQVGTLDGTLFPGPCSSHTGALPSSLLLSSHMIKTFINSPPVPELHSLRSDCELLELSHDKATKGWKASAWLSDSPGQGTCFFRGL